MFRKSGVMSIKNYSETRRADEELRKEIDALLEQMKYKIDKILLKEFDMVLRELADFRNGYMIVRGAKHPASGYLTPNNAQYFQNMYDASQAIIKLLATKNPEVEIIKEIQAQVLEIRKNLHAAMRVAENELKDHFSNEKEKKTFQEERQKLRTEYFKAITKTELFGLSTKYLIADSISYISLAKVSGAQSSWVTDRTWHAFVKLQYAIDTFVDEYGAKLGLNKSSEDLLKQVKNIIEISKPPEGIEQQLAQIANISHVRFKELIEDIDGKTELSDTFINSYIALYDAFQEFNLSLKHNEVKNALEKKLEKEQATIRNLSAKFKASDVPPPKTLQEEVTVEGLEAQSKLLDTTIVCGLTFEPYHSNDKKKSKDSGGEAKLPNDIELGVCEEANLLAADSAKKGKVVSPLGIFSRKNKECSYISVHQQENTGHYHQKRK